MTEPIGVIGGTGLYELPGVAVVGEHTPDTPFGPPSGTIVEVSMHDAPVYFLPRHGSDHSFLPHEINYRANLFALKSLGVTTCLSICASGSLREEYKPGDFALIDQVIDFTVRRNITFFGKGLGAYPSLADPTDVELAKAAAPAFREKMSGTLHEKGTYLCIEGPHLSTRAESEMFRRWGADIIGMTACPEAHLATEAQMSFLLLAMVTDYDCWKEGEEDVSAEGVLAMAARTTQEVHTSLPGVLKVLQEKGRSSKSAKKLEGALMVDPATAPHKEVLEVLLK